MKFYKYLFSILGFLVTTHSAISQSKLVDSLELVISKSVDDTNKIKNLINLGWEYSNVNLKKADSISFLIIELCDKLNYQIAKGGAYNTLGKTKIFQNKPKESIDNYLKAAAVYKKFNNIKGLATIYSNLGNVYGDIGQTEKSLQFYYKSLNARKEIKDEKGLGDCYNNLGVAYKNRGLSDSAVYYHNLALKIRTKINYKGGIAFSLINLSGIYTDFGDYKTGLEYMIRAAKILEKEGDQRGLLMCLVNIAESDIRIKDFKNARKYVDQANKIAVDGGFKFSLSIIYRMYSSIFLESKDYLKASEYAFKAYKNSRSINDLNQMGLALSILASINTNQKNYYAADTCLKRAIDMAKKNHFNSDLGTFLISYAKLKLEENITDHVLEYLNEAEKVSIDAGAIMTQRMKLYDAYVDYYKKINKPIEALKYYEKYANIKDSTYNYDVAQKIEQLQAVYELDLKDKKINYLQQQAHVRNLELNEKTLKLQRRNLIIAITSISILLLIIGVLLFTRFQKLENNKKQFALIKETEVFERRRIAKDIHDELGSGLTKIKFISEQLQSENKDSHLSKNLKTISETVYSLVDNMRDLIWALNPNNTTLDNLLARIREYCSEYMEEIHMDFVVNFPEQIPNKRINNQAHRNIFLTVKEALQNTVKHAHATKIEFNVIIENSNLTAHFKDNGIGFDVNKTQNLESNGMLNMKHRIETIGGSYQILSGSAGTEIIFTVSLDTIDYQNNTLV